MHARLACGCRVAFREGVEGSPVTVVVEAGRIRELNPARQPAGATVLDLGDVTLLPGLIDAHTHLSFDIEGDWLTRAVRETSVDAALRGARNARRTLMAGITTVRDVGSPGFADVSLRRAIDRDLMRTYASSYWQTLVKLKLPAASPFIFNALKINSTLALIGAIVAEFFGTPIVGMGFRISAEVGRMNIDMVWASIAVAALSGSLFYGVVALVERAVTFWHPSVRGG